MTWIEQRQEWDEAKDSLASLEAAIEGAGGNMAELARRLGLSMSAVRRRKAELKASPTGKTRTRSEVSKGWIAQRFVHPGSSDV